jgi:hypothetical protein
MLEVNSILDAANAAAPKVARFRAAKVDPDQHAPCLECGAPIAREKITDPRFMLCRNSCKRRFAARMKADGRDAVATMDRAFRDVFSISRGHRDLARARSAELPLLPIQETWLLHVTRTMAPGKIDPYKESGLMP